MGRDDFICDDTTCRRVTCKCGAIYDIVESDGIPGCRDVERVYCQFCGEELARHFGDCDGYLISDAAVDGRLKGTKKHNE